MTMNRKRQAGLAVLALMLAPGAATGQTAPADGASEWNLHYGNRTKAPPLAVEETVIKEMPVKVRYLIDKKGRVSRCEVLESSGHEKLDKKTCSIIEQRFKFEPKVENGKRVPEWRTQTVRYQITE